MLLLFLSVVRWHRKRAADRGIHVLRAVEEADFRIDLNAAGADELQLLPNVGPTTAQRIVAWRQANGPFESPDDLAQIRGISSRTLEGLHPYVRCGASGERTTIGKGGQAEQAESQAP